MTTDIVRPLYLNNQWKKSGKTLEVTNPADGSVVGQIATIGRAEMKQALEDAQAAWTGWRKLTAQERGQYLLRIADFIDDKADEISRTVTRENGKPLPQAKAEVALTADHFRWFAEEGKRVYGRVVPHQKAGKRHMVLKSPVGVVGAITPWNFPIVLAARKVAPALAVGCPAILRPASSTPLSSWYLAQAAEAAELPAGVFQYVVGSAKELAAELLENPICRKITFTGSTEVGRELMRGAANRVLRLSLELGGHAPLLVFEDANLDKAVEGAAITKFRNTGQSCIASNRIYVQRAVYDRFLKRFVERTKAMKIGEGFTEGVEIGPLIDQKSLDHALGQIEQAKSVGATVQYGGKRWGSQGYFLEPTILTDVPETAACMREESFAPIAPVLPFDTEEEAIRRANDTEYGLSAYLFTENLSRAWRVAEQLEAGTVGLNDSVPATSQCPFGGFKQSGLERELGIEGLEAYLEVKHVSLGGID